MSDAVKTLDAFNACFRAGVSFQQALEQIDGCETMAILARYWNLLEMERALAMASRCYSKRGLASASQYWSDRAAVAASDRAAVAAEIEAAS